MSPLYLHASSFYMDEPNMLLLMSLTLIYCSHRVLVNLTFRQQINTELNRHC